MASPVTRVVLYRRPQLLYSLFGPSEVIVDLAQIRAVDGGVAHFAFYILILLEGFREEPSGLVDIAEMQLRHEVLWIQLHCALERLRGLLGAAHVLEADTEIYYGFDVLRVFFDLNPPAAHIGILHPRLDEEILEVLPGEVEFGIDLEGLLELADRLLVHPLSEVEDTEVVQSSRIISIHPRGEAQEYIPLLILGLSHLPSFPPYITQWGRDSSPCSRPRPRGRD